MSAAATIVSTDLIELFDTVPDYLEYQSPQSIMDLESDYRVALGRLAKTWGDQLLELAERPSVPLSSEDAEALDSLLARISDVFEQLNAFRGAVFDPENSAGRQRLRVSDAQILHTVESTMSLLAELDPARGPGIWIEMHGAPFQRRLLRLSRELRRRNRLLKGITEGPGSRTTRSRGAAPRHREGKGQP
jgi:hypothetical protein